MLDDDIVEAAKRLLDICKRKNLTVATAESCTAGLVAGSAEKPVGLVHFAAAARSGRLAHAERRFGDIGRADIRKLSVLQAFRMLHDLAEGEAARPARG